jgi:hypothetical protein
MKNFEINDFILSKTQIGNTEYKISVFKNEKYLFQFTVSLQPTGDDKILPTYQLFPNTQIVPDWLKENLNILSNWIKIDDK